MDRDRDDRLQPTECPTCHKPYVHISGIFRPARTCKCEPAGETPTKETEPKSAIQIAGERDASIITEPVDWSGEQPSQQPSEQPKCGKFVASFIPRRGEYFSCVLAPNHEGECRPGGTCVKHGPYVGEANKPPTCPKWPACTEPDSVDIGADVASEQPTGIEGLADEELLNKFQLTPLGKLRDELLRRLRSHTSVPRCPKCGSTDFREWVEDQVFKFFCNKCHHHTAEVIRLSKLAQFFSPVQEEP